MVGSKPTRYGSSNQRGWRRIKDFGFGKRLGVDLPGEVSGVVRPPKYWSNIAVDTISFGHGISVSAIQLITGFCAIANNGILMRPYIVKQIITSEERVLKEFKPHIERRIISEKTAREVFSILKTTVHDGGTGRKASISGCEVAGKTGTAQKANSVSGGYIKGKYIASFMGAVPADNPDYQLIFSIHADYQL